MYYTDRKLTSGHVVDETIYMPSCASCEIKGPFSYRDSSEPF